jgi:hypothetical protein
MYKISDVYRVKIPEHTAELFERWINEANDTRLSGFHWHILEGRYLEAAAVADEGNLAGLGYLLASMTDWPLCYGSPEMVQGWRKVKTET